jgi:hypothetical protein
LRQGWETADVIEATGIPGKGVWAELQKGETILEGLKAFQRKAATKKDTIEVVKVRAFLVAFAIVQCSPE